MVNVPGPEVAGLKLVPVTPVPDQVPPAVAEPLNKLVKLNRGVMTAEVMHRKTTKLKVTNRLGSPVTAANSVYSLRPLGRHVQIGLFPSATADFPVSRVIRDELEVLGVHGLSASRFREVLGLMHAGRLDPTAMITRRVSLYDVPTALPAMGAFASPGVTVVTDLRG